MKKVLLVIIAFIMLFCIDVNAYTGWKTVKTKKYYYVNNVKTKGIKKINKKYYYFNNSGVLQKNKLLTIKNEKYYATSNGSFYTGWKTIKNKKYYFNPTNRKAVKGYFDINGKTYSFNDDSGKLRTGWLTVYKDKFYSDKNGIVYKGWQTIDGKKYYFNENEPYEAYRGYKEVDNKLYYFDKNNGYLRIGWKTINNTLFYSDENGVVYKGWKTIDGKKYYFNEKEPHETYRGYKEIDGNLYYFDDVTGVLRTGWETKDNKTYYSSEEGIVYRGWQTFDDGKYYFNINSPYEAATGAEVVDGKKLVFNEKGKLSYGKNIIFGNEYYSTEDTGEFIKLNYIPPYYNQKDKRWKNKKYGSWLFGGTGCTPTSLAMAFQSILEKEILPTEIADYLYKNTNQYNRKLPGTSGKGIIYASKYYGVKAIPILNKDDLRKYLSEGYIVYASMQNGKYATKDWNHAIIMYNYQNDSTYALDPLLESNNGYVSIDQIWKEKNTDPDDTTGGSAIYALLPKE